MVKAKGEGSNESYFLVPGERRGDTPSPAQGDDLCREGRLRAHAAGTVAAPDASRGPSLIRRLDY